MSVGLGVLSIRIWDGWLYLAVIIYLFSRRTIGWSMQPVVSKNTKALPSP